MSDPKNKQYNVAGLVAAGIVLAIVGVTIIVQPISYYSAGKIGYHESVRVASAFTGNDSALFGCIFLFMSAFILSVAYKLKTK